MRSIRYKVSLWKHALHIAYQHENQRIGIFQRSQGTFEYFLMILTTVCYEIIGYYAKTRE